LCCTCCCRLSLEDEEDGMLDMDDGLLQIVHFKSNKVTMTNNMAMEHNAFRNRRYCVKEWGALVMMMKDNEAKRAKIQV